MLKPDSVAGDDSSNEDQGEEKAGGDGEIEKNIREAERCEVVRVDAEKNLILINGCVPGPKGALITLKNSVKVWN